MEQPKKLIVENNSGRLDRFIAQHCPELSRSFIQKLIARGWVTVNANKVKPSSQLKSGDCVVVTEPPPEPSPLAPESVSLDIRYEDADIIVVNKPPGMTTHPAPGSRSGTLVNALLGFLPKLAESDNPERPGIVHRLDKDTSGLIVVAKNRKALENLSDQFKSRQVQKGYLALVRGHVQPEVGLIDAPIGRDPIRRQKMAIVDSGRPAQTEYRVKCYLENHTLLALKPATGRTHQIRVHLSGIGHPVAGDVTYGTKSVLVARQFLHAYRLSFRLPLTGEEITITADIPSDLRAALDKLSCPVSNITSV